MCGYLLLLINVGRLQVVDIPLGGHYAYEQPVGLRDDPLSPTDC